MKARTMFASRADGDEWLNYVVVWTDATHRQQAEYFHTRNQAEKSNSFQAGVADIFTRKQFESLTTAAERKALLTN